MDKVIMVNPERMEYKGYAGNINYDRVNNQYFGNILEPVIMEEIRYVGRTVHDLMNAFLELVENQIALAAE